MTSDLTVRLGDGSVTVHGAQGGDEVALGLVLGFLGVFFVFVRKLFDAFDVLVVQKVQAVLQVVQAIRETPKRSGDGERG